jgi:glycosyltransferase involved in cell wall biosynthesis
VRIVSDPSRLDLRELYRSASYFVLSSAEEGLGIVLIEAMSSGLALISTATEGGKYVLRTDDVGLLVPLGASAPNAIADHMLLLDRDANLRTRMGQNARAAALERFSLETAGGDFLEVLGSL